MIRKLLKLSAASVFAFAAIAGTQTKINPKTQIAWPASCQVYNVSTASCPPIGTITFTGTWNSGTTYLVNQAAYFSGSTYVSLQSANLNHTPNTSPAYWSLFASASSVAVTTNVLKGDGGGAAIAATPGTDYVIPAGNVATATALQNSPGQCGTGVVAGGIQQSGTANCKSPAVAPSYMAWDSASLATALSAASTFTTSTGGASTVYIGPGNYNLTQQFSEPMTNGSGVSLVGVAGATNIYMNADNGGSPWEAVIYRGATAGNTGYFSITGLNFYCTNAAKSAMNALYGIELKNAKNVHVSQVQTHNCGSMALGGTGIATGGGGVTDETQVFMDDILVNYDEGFYTGPAGGAGPTPPDYGIALRGSTGDSVLQNLLIRNPQTCGVAVLHKGGGERSTGGIVVNVAHVFGFTSTLAVPIPYFPLYAYCDESDFGGDRWLNVEVDSVRTSGFYMDMREVGGTTGINSVQIVAPSFYWWTAAGGSFADYPTPPNLMSLSAGAVGHVDVLDPVCTNHAYTSGSGTYITNASLITPAIYGGIGCGLQDKDGKMNLLTPMNVGVNGESAHGDGTLATNWWSFSGQRAAVGYSTSIGAALFGGNGISLCTGAFATPTCGAIYTNAGGLKLGGTPSSTPNFTLDPSGITAPIKGANIASASTIAPTSAVTAITGTSTINTITPPAVCTTSSNACRITLTSVDGFALGTSGNIGIAAAVPFGTSIDLVYIQSSSQWIIPRTALSNTTPSIGGGLISPGCSNFATVSVPGATTTMACYMSGTGGNPTGITPQCSVTASNTVLPQLCTAVGGGTTPSSQTYNVRVIP